MKFDIFIFLQKLLLNHKDSEINMFNLRPASNEV